MGMTPAKVCIIGAGCSGLAAANVLHARGLPYDCFEMSSGIGGVWRYRNDNGLSAAYDSLHINTSKERMAFEDFPMPDHYPDYLHHSQVLAYFEAYVDHFGFRDTITFRTEVTDVSPVEEGAYDVTTRNRDTGEHHTERYGAVIVANGHHWDPQWPSFRGSFDGQEIHSRDYTTSEQLRDRRVLVVGVGNSGLDIASQAARVAKRAVVSTRRGAHIMPKYLLGRPSDHWLTPATSQLPLAIQRLGMRLMLWLTRGDQEAYGFPRPPHPLGAEHPSISSDVLDHIGHGRLSVRPNIERMEGDTVRFVDGTTEAFDLIVYATGYHISFPFFDDDVLSIEGNEVRFYRYVVPPRRPNLYFIGLVQPLGAVMPISERQSKWVADLLDGTAGLPPINQMEEAIEQTREAVRQRYTHSKRHTIQVDFHPYMAQLAREREKGRSYPSVQQLPARFPVPHSV